MFGGNNNASMGPADFAAMMGGAGNVFGNGGEGFWILIILFALFGWGGNGFGGNGGGRGSYPVIYGAGGAGGNELYPWLNQSQTQAQGFANISTQLCNGFGNIQTTLANGFAGVESGANARQIANMQQGFAMQTALLEGFNSLGSQFADCCCENRLATANQTATILAEHCADRNALQMGIRDVIDNDNRIGQSIMDKLCQLELDGVKSERDADRREIDNLRQQLTAANFAASQVTQNGLIIDGIYNRLATCPVGTQPVYGNQPIFTCRNQNPNGCPCNNNQVLYN